MSQQYENSSNGNINPIYREVIVGNHTIRITYLENILPIDGADTRWEKFEPVGPPVAPEGWENELYDSIRDLNSVRHPIGPLSKYVPIESVVRLFDGRLPWQVELPKNVEDLGGIVLAIGLWLGRTLDLPLDEVKSNICQYLSDKDALERIMDDRQPVAVNK